MPRPPSESGITATGAAESPSKAEAPATASATAASAAPAPAPAPAPATAAAAATAAALAAATAAAPAPATTLGAARGAKASGPVEVEADLTRTLTLTLTPKPGPNPSPTPKQPVEVAAEAEVEVDALLRELALTPPVSSAWVRVTAEHLLPLTTHHPLPTTHYPLLATHDALHSFPPGAREDTALAAARPARRVVGDAARARMPHSAPTPLPPRSNTPHVHLAPSQARPPLTPSSLASRRMGRARGAASPWPRAPSCSSGRSPPSPRLLRRTPQRRPRPTRPTPCRRLSIGAPFLWLSSTATLSRAICTTTWLVSTA